MPIEIPKIRGSVRAPGRGRVPTSVTDLASAERGQRAAVQLGAAVLGMIAKATQSQALVRANNRITKWQMETAQQFQDTENSTQATNLLAAKLDEWEEVYNRVADEEGNGLIPLLRGDYDNAMAEGYAGATSKVSNSLLKMGQDAFRAHNQVEFEEALESIKANAAQQDGPWRPDEDQEYQRLLQHIDNSATVAGATQTASHLGALQRLVPELQAQAFEGEMDRIASGPDGFEGAIEWASQPGVGEDFGLSHAEAQQRINVFKSRVETQQAQRQQVIDDQQEQELDLARDEMIQDVISGTYDPSTMLRNPFISNENKLKLISDAQSLTTAITPNDSDFDAIESVETAIDAFAMGSSVVIGGKTVRANKEYARKVFMDNFGKLDKGDRDKYQNQIYGEQDKTFNQNRSFGRYYLKSGLLTGQNLFGIRIPAGPAQQGQYENASVLFELQLEQWQKAGSWPNPSELYVFTQDLINKVKDPNFSQSNTSIKSPPAQVDTITVDGKSVNVGEEFRQGGQTFRYDGKGRATRIK